MVSDKIKPEIIQKVGFDFSWDERLVWALDYPVEKVPINELTWHFDVPFIWSKPEGYYDVLPSDVLRNPEKYSEEYNRTLSTDISYPIDIMYWRDRWVILDGLHRLMKLSIEGAQMAQVRKIPQSAIPLIIKTP